MKSIYVPILSSLAIAFPIAAETVYTIPQGYTKVTVAAADEAGSSKLTAISASLLQDVEYSGSASLGAYTAGNTSQKLDVSGATWSVGQWTTAGPASSPYLAYVSVADDPGNADGIAPAEEAFLINANNTTGELTIETSFDLASRFPASTTVKIRKANTLDSFFGSQSASFGGNDIVYIWNGSAWSSFQYVGGQWTTINDPFADVGPITVIHPDEGVFISRAETSPVVVTLFGEVPSAPQIATISGVSFLASRFPIATSLKDLGVATTSWTGNDILYIWDQDASPVAKWDSYQYNGGQWTTVNDPFTSVDDTEIPANSAVFVSRSTEITGANADTTAILPYTID